MSIHRTSAKTWSRVVSMVAITALAVTLSACASQTPKAATSKSAAAKSDGCSTSVNFVEGGSQIFRLPAYIAMTQGYFKDEGITPTFTEVSGGPQTAQVIAGGQGQFGLGQLVDLMNMRAGGIKAHAIGMLTDKLSTALTVSKKVADAGKLGPSTLRNSTIGITSVGSGTWQWVLYVAKEMGVSESELHLVTIGQDAVDSLKSGRVDMLSFADPQQVALVQGGDADWFVDPENVNNGITSKYKTLTALTKQPYVNNIVYATDDYLAKCPVVSQKVYDALQKSADFIKNSSLDKITTSLLKFDSFKTQDKGQLKASLKRLLDGNADAENIAISSKAFNNEMDYLTSVGSMYKAASIKALVNPTFAKAAK